MLRRASLCTLALLATSLVGCNNSAPATAPPAPVAAPAPAPLARLELPPLISFPEGVTYDAVANTLYTGSAADGALVKVNAATGAVDLVTQSGVLVPTGTTTFPALLGMKIDGTGRLWIAGGRSAKMWVVKASDGKLIKAVTTPTAGTSLINDVALVGGAGYFTDTFVPTLWRLASKGDQIGALEPWLSLKGTPIAYADGPNLNGIAATPDEKTLIVVQMNKGLLFKVDVASKAVTPIDTAGADLTGGDGLVLDGRTLYVVRQTAVEIATVQLSEDLARGTVVARFKDPALAWPATAAKVGGDLVVVNTQFNTRDPKTTTLPFTLVKVPLSRLAAR